MKKILSLFCFIAIFSTGISFGQKYKVNTSGRVKKHTGEIITSPSNTINQNFYNNYQATNYIDSNQVNNTPSINNIEFVMDYSGSMYNWIGVAKRSMSSIISQIPSNVNIGFRVFGQENNAHKTSIEQSLREVKKIVKNGNKFKVITQRNYIGKKSGACSNTTQVTPIIPANSNALISGMNSVNIGGSTPLVYALDRTVNQDFKYLDKFSPKKIVLITDGGENCGGDPCAFAKNLMNKRKDIHIDVVLVSSSSNALACVTQETGGNFYNINDLADFSNTITKTINSQPNKNSNQKQKYEFIKE